MTIEPLAINAYTTVNALGQGVTALLAGLRNGTSGLRRSDFLDADLDTWIGPVDALDDIAIAAELAAYDCRNNRLAQLGLQQDGFAEAVTALRARYGAGRIGVFIGTSTSGILSTELAYRERATPDAELPPGISFRHSHDVFAAADFVQHYLGLTGPVLGISTACSSGAKAFASAWRYINLGMIDAAVVGGVDSLCLTTLYGFHSLALTAADICRPWDVERAGISLGEAAAFALLERPNRNTAAAAIQLCGYGESSDAHHMSAAHPEGAGAQRAMRLALTRAGVSPAQIDYVNLHGTATLSNDASEDYAVVKVLGQATPCSSTKGWTGHTLGAAGALEAVIACVCLQYNLLPGTLNTRTVDPALKVNLLRDSESQQVTRVLSNSFGFGGSNCSLVFARNRDAPAVAV